MPTQRSVAVQFWNSKIAKSLPPSGKLLALHMMTGTDSNYVGLFRFSFENCVDETGLARDEIAQFLDTLQVVQDDGDPFLHYDHETRVIWVTKRLEYEFPNRKLSPTQRQFIRKLIELLPACKILGEVCERYTTVFPLGEPFCSVLDTLSHRVSDRVSDGVCDTPRIRLSALGSLLSAPSSQERKNAVPPPGAGVTAAARPDGYDGWPAEWEPIKTRIQTLPFLMKWQHWLSDLDWWRTLDEVYQSCPSRLDQLLLDAVGYIQTEGYQPASRRGLLKKLRNCIDFQARIVEREHAKQRRA